VVEYALINGKIAWENHRFSERFGTDRFGVFLRGQAPLLIPLAFIRINLFDANQ
jgi:hypothetical protein